MVGGRGLLLGGDLDSGVLDRPRQALDVQLAVSHALEVADDLALLARLLADSGEVGQVLVAEADIAQRDEVLDAVGLPLRRRRNEGLEVAVPARELDLADGGLDTFGQTPGGRESIGLRHADADDPDSIIIEADGQLGGMECLAGRVLAGGQDAGLDGDELVHKFVPFIIGPVLNEAVRLDSDGHYAQGPRALGDIARRG